MPATTVEGKLPLPQNTELRREIEQIIVNSEVWLNTPHPELHNHKPIEFLESGREQPLRDLVAAIKYGQFS
ncbi:MAG TPA: MbcA/ParS/Xre antitoxin family protein [Chthonomonadaceae bacterium]|nr:MbcA/ParS/Xre antitoxin family protein [Chthonomonadaceae bacterium]